jgi:hypothetical protein
MNLLTSHKLLLLIVLPLSTSALRLLVSEQEDTSVLDPVFRTVSEQTNVIQMKHYSGIRIAAVGWKKTGTSSMHAAYDLLGMQPVGGVNGCKTPSCMHKYAGVEDAYACCNHGLVQAMKARYPADLVKFVLTERIPSKWRSSIDRWVHRKDKGERFMNMYGQLMGAKFGSEEFYEMYEQHNAFIKQLFADQPDRLLVLNLEEDDPVKNMQKFCKFVNIDPEDLPACNRPFPHQNANPALVRENNTWLNFDDDEHELDHYESQWATFDWMKWYESKGFELDRDIVFEADEAN